MKNNSHSDINNQYNPTGRILMILHKRIVITSFIALCIFCSCQSKSIPENPNIIIIMTNEWQRQANKWIEDNKDNPFFLFFSSHDIHVPRLVNVSKANPV